MNLLQMLWRLLEGVSLLPFDKIWIFLVITLPILLAALFMIHRFMTRLDPPYRKDGHK
jgi:membrane protein implicated in regulation of membrane protease activity